MWEKDGDRTRSEETEINKQKEKAIKSEHTYRCASVRFSDEPRPCWQVESRGDRKRERLERGWEQWTQGHQ